MTTDKIKIIKETQDEITMVYKRQKHINFVSVTSFYEKAEEIKNHGCWLWEINHFCIINNKVYCTLSKR